MPFLRFYVPFLRPYVPFLRFYVPLLRFYVPFLRVLGATTPVEPETEPRVGHHRSLNRVDEHFSKKFMKNLRPL